MHQTIPTRWMAVLFFLSVVTTWTACSKEYSLENDGTEVIDEDDPIDTDSTGNDDDDTTISQGPVGDTTALSDINFINQASYVNYAQIENGRLAADRGAAQAVSDFGTAVNSRFGLAQTDMEVLGTALNVTVPGRTDAAHSTVTNSFLELEGRTFDIGFTDYEVAELQRAIDLYRAVIANTKDSRIKAYANKYLPYLEEFLQTASTIRQIL